MPPPYLIPKLYCQFTEFLGRVTVYPLKAAKGVVYQRKIRYSADNKLYYNICKPKTVGDASLPVFLYIHGGGWVSGNPECRQAFVSQFAAAGYFTVSVYYGYSPKYRHPHAVENIYKALAHVLEREKEYGIDCTRIYVGGESAGAHLAATLGAISSHKEFSAHFHLPQTARELRFGGLLLNCGIYDMETALKTGFPAVKSYIYAYYKKPLAGIGQDADAAYLSPGRFVTNAFPESFIITAKKDRLQTEGTALAERFAEIGVPHKTYHGTSPFAVHAFPVAQMFQESRAVTQQAVAFLNSIDMAKREL